MTKAATGWLDHSVWKGQPRIADWALPVDPRQQQLV
jgi:hypothetical protein